MGLLVLNAAALCAGPKPDKDWQNLGAVTRDRNYVVVLQGCTAVYGRLMSVDENGLQLEEESWNRKRIIALKRSGVLRIGETSNVRDVIFSATSSWLYVKAAASARTEYLIVETRDGRRWRLNRPTVSDAAIMDRGKVMPKAEVRSVFYVRYKPFSDREEYFWRESGSFGYVLMPVRAILQPKLSVRLYDSDSQEDTSQAICSAP
jgi:hypothetical protein